MNRYFGITLGTVLAGLLAIGAAHGQATLLPDALQSYYDNNGKPLANGNVYFYVPGTTTPSTTWTSASESVAQPQPVPLGSAGRPASPIFGSGSYRQIVQDQFGNVIWDAVTASTGSGSGGGSSGVTAGDGNAVGTVLLWTGTSLPANYLYTAGQAISRTTYAQLLTAITYSTTALCQAGIASITVPTAVSDGTPIGAPVEASCFAPGTIVSSKTSGQLTMSNNATTTTSTTLVVFPWGNGDGATTFNVPDYRGRVIPGRDNMGGSTAGILLSGVYGSNPDAINAQGGNLSTQLTLNQLPSGITSSNAAQSIVVGAVGAGVLPILASGDTWESASGSNGSGQNWVRATSNVGPSSITSLSGSNSISVTSNNAGKGQAVSATIGSGGSGYTSGTQTLSLSGGTCSIPPQFSVTVTGGVASSPILVNAGQCAIAPTNPAATTGGGGTGATLNVTYSSLPLGTIPPSVTSDYIIKALPNSIIPYVYGFNVLAPSELATTTALPNSPTYSNGITGVGATLTAGSNSTLTVDGTVAALGNVVLVNNQTDGTQNGIYSVTVAGSGSTPWVLTRVTYFDTPAQMLVGSYTFITGGNTNGQSAWILANSVNSVGVNVVNFVLFYTNDVQVGSITGLGTGVATALGQAVNTAGGIVAPSAAFTQYGVIYGGGSGVSPTSTAVGTSGQLFLGVTSSAPQWGTMGGDATVANTGTLTFATVNSNTGSFGSATQCVAFTVNGKGLLTAASATTCTPAVGSITGFGTGIATALATAVGSAGAPVLFNGAGGTPSSLTLTNAAGLPFAGLPSGTSDTALGYWGATSVSALAINNCTNALTYSTSTHTFGCNVVAGTGTVTEQKNTAGTGLTTSGNCDNTSSNATSPCRYAFALTGATLQATPTSPSPTTSTTGVMMGLGSTCTITPVNSTKVKFEIIGEINNNTASDSVTDRIYYGTGAAPSNGAATTGTQIGNAQTYNAPIGGGYNVPFANGGIVTGLFPGVVYWFDANIYVTSGGTGTIASLSCNAFEVY